jgi:hypothetical protein
MARGCRSLDSDLLKSWNADDLAQMPSCFPVVFSLRPLRLCEKYSSAVPEPIRSSQPFFRSLAKAQRTQRKTNAISESIREIHLSSRFSVLARFRIARTSRRKLETAAHSDSSLTPIHGKDLRRSETRWHGAALAGCECEPGVRDRDRDRPCISCIKNSLIQNGPPGTSTRNYLIGPG